LTTSSTSAARQELGVVLSGGSTIEAKIQLRDKFERETTEGKLVEVETTAKNGNVISILARISKIQPHNEFYNAGDGWTQSRREGYNIPDSVARQYVICELDIIGTLPRMGPVTSPPVSNDNVFDLDITDKKRIYGIGDGEPGHIWFGTLNGYSNAPIPLDVQKFNMHMAIFGKTGSGKSFTTGALIEKLANIPTGTNEYGALPLIIIDSNGDYGEYTNPTELRKFTHDGQTERTDPLSRIAVWNKYVFHGSVAHQRDNAIPIHIDFGVLEPDELAQLIMQWYYGHKDSEPLPVAGLELILETVWAADITGGFGNPDSSTSNPDPRPNYAPFFATEAGGFFDNEVVPIGERLVQQNRIHQSTFPTIVRAVRNFARQIQAFHLLDDPKTINNDFLDRVTTNKEVSIFDFSADGCSLENGQGVSKEFKQVVVGVIASIFYKRFNQYHSQTVQNRQAPIRTLGFLIEEAQDYIPDPTVYKVGGSFARKTLHQIATQARKMGVGLIVVSQSPSFLDPVVMSQINQYLIHTVSFRDVNFVKKVSGGLTADLEKRLTKLPRGQLIVQGVMSDKLPIPLLINIPATDRLMGHAMGTPDILGGLRIVAPAADEPDEGEGNP